MGLRETFYNWAQQYDVPEILDENTQSDNQSRLQEAYQAGYYRALNEDLPLPWTPNLQTSYNANAQFSRPSKYSTANQQGREDPKPLSVSKAYMEDLYGMQWPSIMQLLELIMGPNWWAAWQNIIHDGSWNWPGWTPTGDGGYYLSFGNDGAWMVQFVDGSWMFSHAVP